MRTARQPSKTYLVTPQPQTSRKMNYDHQEQLVTQTTDEGIKKTKKLCKKLPDYKQFCKMMGENKKVKKPSELTIVKPKIENGIPLKSARMSSNRKLTSEKVLKKDIAPASLERLNKIDAQILQQAFFSLQTSPPQQMKQVRQRSRMAQKSMKNLPTQNTCSSLSSLIQSPLRNRKDLKPQTQRKTKSPINQENQDFNKPSPLRQKKKLQIPAGLLDKFKKTMIKKGFLNSDSIVNLEVKQSNVKSEDTMNSSSLERGQSLLTASNTMSPYSKKDITSNILIEDDCAPHYRTIVGSPESQIIRVQPKIARNYMNSNRIDSNHESDIQKQQQIVVLDQLPQFDIMPQQFECFGNETTKLLDLKSQICDLQAQYFRELKKVMKKPIKKGKKIPIKNNKIQEDKQDFKKTIVSDLSPNICDTKSSKPQSIITNYPNSQNEVQSEFARKLHLCADNLVSVRHSFSPGGIKQVSKIPSSDLINDGRRTSRGNSKKKQPDIKISQQGRHSIQQDSIKRLSIKSRQNSKLRKIDAKHDQKIVVPYVPTIDTEEYKQFDIVQDYRDQVYLTPMEIAEEIPRQDQIITKFESFIEKLKQSHQLPASIPADDSSHSGGALGDYTFQNKSLVAPQMTFSNQEELIQYSQQSQNDYNDDEVITTYLSPENDNAYCLTSSECCMTNPSQNIQKSENIPAIPYCHSPTRLNYLSEQSSMEPIRNINRVQEAYFTQSLSVGQIILKTSESVRDLSKNAMLIEEKLSNSCESLIASPQSVEQKLDEIILEMSDHNQSSYHQNILEDGPESKSPDQQIVKSDSSSSLIMEQKLNELQQEHSRLIEIASNKSFRSTLFKQNLNELNQSSDEEVKHNQSSVIQDRSLQEIKTKLLTGHQKYTKSKPTKKSECSHSIFIRTSQNNSSSSMFERNSFHLFNSKLSKVFKAEAYLQSLISDLNHALDKRALKKPKFKNVSLDQSNERSMNRSVEKWVQAERKEVLEVQKHLMQGCSKLQTLIEYVMKENAVLKVKVSTNQSYYLGQNKGKKELQKKKSKQASQSFQEKLFIDQTQASVKRSPALKLEDIVEEKIIIPTESKIKVYEKAFESPIPKEKKDSSSNSSASNEANRVLQFEDCDEKEILLRISTPPKKLFQKEQIDLKSERRLRKSEDDLTLSLDQEKKIETSTEYINQYIFKVLAWVDKDKELQASTIEIVSQAFHKDSFMILAHMQNPEILYGKEAAIDYQLPYYELPFQPPVLPVDLYLQIEKARFKESLKHHEVLGSPLPPSAASPSENNSSFIVELENIHNKAIFDGLNEALDGMRPYGLKGPPVSWSKQSKSLTFKYGNTDAYSQLLSDAKHKVLSWAIQGVGIISDDQYSKKDIDKIREIRLQKLLVEEIEESDKAWCDFEMEETQVKLDITDIILKMMCEETAQIFNQIKCQ